MGEYEYHANPIDWQKPRTAPAKGGTPADSGVFRPPTVGRVGSLFNKIEVICLSCFACRPLSNRRSQGCCQFLHPASLGPICALLRQAGAQEQRVCIQYVGLAAAPEVSVCNCKQDCKQERAASTLSYRTYGTH